MQVPAKTANGKSSANMTAPEIHRLDSLQKSERRLRSLLSATSQVAWTAGEDGLIEELSDTWAGLTGQSNDEMRGWGWAQVLHPDDYGHVIDAWQHHLDQKTTCEVECRIRLRNGQYRWTAIRAVPVVDDNGDFVEWIGTCTDVDARKRTEAALLESEARHRAIADTAQEGVRLEAQSRARYERLVNHIDGIVWEGTSNLETGEVAFTLVSERLRKILGYNPQSWVDDASLWIEAIHGEDRTWAPAACMASTRDRHDHAIEYRMTTADGRIVWLRDLVRVVEADGDIVTSAGVMFDVTEQKEAEQALVEAKERAEELAGLKSAFLANMSHEIRTPLTSILGFAEVLEVEPTENVRAMAKHIMNAGQRLMLTLDSVMDLAQLESGSIRLHLVEIDLVKHVKELLPMFERHAQHQGLSLEFECQQRSLNVFADTGALFRVLTNLLSNAIKFTTEGGVTVRLQEQDGFVRMDVTDTGIGMGEAFLAKLFQDFKQESEGFSRNYEGVGLGLSITKRLVDLMAGSIEVTSRKGQGSTFTVRLPNRAPKSAVELKPARPETIPASSRRSILVVEDQDDAQHLICHLLQPTYEVDIAVTAEEALAAVQRRSYDLILMDINLGGKGPDGTEVFKQIRSQESFADVPVIACTAYALPGDEDRFITEGFDGYIGKPFRKADLFSLISKLLSR